jgi:hypothetical protein
MKMENGERIHYCKPLLFFLFQKSIPPRMVYTVQKRIFIVESYIRDRSYKTTTEENEQKKTVQKLSAVFVSFLTLYK